MITFAELVVEEAGVFVTDGENDITDGQLGFVQQANGLAEALLLQELAERSAAKLAHTLGEVGNTQAKAVCQLCQSGGTELVFEVILNAYLQQLGVRAVTCGSDNAIGNFTEVAQNQTDRHFYGLLAYGIVTDHRVAEVFKEVFKKRNALGGKKHIFRLAVGAHILGHKGGKRRRGGKHRGQRVEGFGCDENIDGNILFTGFADTVLGMAIDKQHIACTHLHLAVLDDLRQLATADVCHFHIIVAVDGEVGKTGMAAQGDLLLLLHQAMIIDDKLFGKGGIQALVNLVFALQNFVLLVTDIGQFCENVVFHQNVSFFIY